MIWGRSPVDDSWRASWRSTRSHLLLFLIMFLLFHPGYQPSAGELRKRMTTVECTAMVGSAKSIYAGAQSANRRVRLEKLPQDLEGSWAMWSTSKCRYVHILCPYTWSVNDSHLPHHRHYSPVRIGFLSHPQGRYGRRGWHVHRGPDHGSWYSKEKRLAAGSGYARLRCEEKAFFHCIEPWLALRSIIGWRERLTRRPWARMKEKAFPTQRRQLCLFRFFSSVHFIRS